MRDARAEIDRAVQAFNDCGWRVDVAETMRPGDATRLAYLAAQQNIDVVIAVGGDGTLNEVANGIVDTPTALGVLPLGTVNLWAREMGLPMDDIVTTARSLTDAKTCAIDVGEIRGAGIAPRIFVLCAGIGIDALVTRDVEPQRQMKRRLGVLLFGVIGVRDALKYRGQLATLVMGGKRIRKRVVLIVVANSQLYGGVVKISPTAKVDDGLLDVVIFKGTGVFATTWHFLRILVGAHIRDPQVEMYRVPSIAITGKNLPAHVDAEPVGFAPLEIRVRPRALQVLVPKTANRNLFV